MKAAAPCLRNQPWSRRGLVLDRALVRRVPFGRFAKPLHYPAEVRWAGTLQRHDPCSMTSRQKAIETCGGNREEIHDYARFTMGSAEMRVNSYQGRPADATDGT